MRSTGEVGPHVFLAEFAAHLHKHVSRGGRSVTPDGRCARRVANIHLLHDLCCAVRDIERCAKDEYLPTQYLGRDCAAIETQIVSISLLDGVPYLSYCTEAVSVEIRHKIRHRKRHPCNKYTEKLARKMKLTLTLTSRCFAASVCRHDVGRPAHPDVGRRVADGEPAGRVRHHSRQRVRDPGPVLPRPFQQRTQGRHQNLPHRDAPVVAAADQ